MSLFFITLGSEKKTLRSYLDKERAQILKYINFTLIDLNRSRAFGMDMMLFLHQWTKQICFKLPSFISASLVWQGKKNLSICQSLTKPKTAWETTYIYLFILSSKCQKNLCTPLFIAAQFTIAKYWKQPKCPSANEWIQKLWCIYTMEFYTAERKKELIPFATAWMELENIMLSKISQTVRDEYHMISPLTGT